MKQGLDLAKRLSNARKIGVLTGAGISAESGVPTFRGSGNTTAVWKGMPFDRVSSAEMIREDLNAVWEWFDYRRGVLATCAPNPAHRILAEWESEFEDFMIVTQNVDGLHSRAGSKNVFEIHGNINRSRCVECEKRFLMEFDTVPHDPVACDDCGGDLRPDVVLFGEMLPIDLFSGASERASGCEIFFVIGTSSLVYPAASLAEIAKRGGAYVVEINLEPTPLTRSCGSSVLGKAGIILPEIDRLFRKEVLSQI